MNIYMNIYYIYTYIPICIYMYTQIDTHTMYHLTWSTNCALCEMMTTPPSYWLMASAMAPEKNT